MAEFVKESLKHYQAFEDYFALAGQRSLANLSEKTGTSVRTLEDWSKKFGWAERVHMRDRAMAEKLAEKTDTDIINEKSKLVNIVKASIAIYVDKLKNGTRTLYDKDGKPVIVPGIKIDSPRDLAILIEKYQDLIGDTPDESIRVLIEDMRNGDNQGESNETLQKAPEVDSKD